MKIRTLDGIVSEVKEVSLADLLSKLPEEYHNCVKKAFSEFSYVDMQRKKAYIPLSNIRKIGNALESVADFKIITDLDGKKRIVIEMSYNKKYEKLFKLLGVKYKIFKEDKKILVPYTEVSLYALLIGRYVKEEKPKRKNASFGLYAFV